MNYKVGDVIEYRTFCGGTRTVQVTSKDDDIKNGRPGFSGKNLTTDPDASPNVWGYDYQIVAVLTA